MRTAYLVQDDTPGQLARAVARYRLQRPAFLVPVLVELALGGVFAAAGHPSWAVLLVVVALLQPILLWRQTGRLAVAMQRRGYRPGTVLEVDWEPERFTVASPDSSASYPYGAVSGAQQVGSSVAMRIRGARVLLVLPVELVPPAARPRLGLPA